MAGSGTEADALRGNGAAPGNSSGLATGTPPILIEGLSKRLAGGILAVDGLSLAVQRGQVLGLAGPNGAGKSVTLKILLGLVRPTAGRVELFGERARPGARALARVGALVDGPGFVPHLSGLANLRLASRMRSGRPREQDVREAVAMAGLGEAIERPYKTYSHGMRYRLGLAQALLGKPELLLLDEPTTGLDPAHVHEVRAAVARAAADGATVVFCSHLLSEVQRVCTHAAIVRAGRLVASGTISDLLGAHASLEQAYLELVGGEARGSGKPVGSGTPGNGAARPLDGNPSPAGQGP